MPFAGRGPEAPPTLRDSKFQIPDSLELWNVERGTRNSELGTRSGLGRPLQVPVGHGLEEVAQAQEQLILSAGGNQLQGNRDAHS